MKTDNYECLPLDRLIDTAIAQGTNSDLVHIVLCEDCRSKVKGLKLSLLIERENNIYLTNEAFKSKRIREINLFCLMFDPGSMLVDMAIKCALSFDQATGIYVDLKADEEEYK